MTLGQVKDKIKSTSLAHKQINGFDYGEDYLMATGKGADYPLVFLEIPYNLSYELSTNRFKTLKFAMLVLLNPSQDDLINDHIAISKSEIIGDVIISKLQKDMPELKLDSVNGVSLREFFDDSVSGFRFDITARTFRECYNADDFKPNC